MFWGQNSFIGANTDTFLGNTVIFRTNTDICLAQPGVYVTNTIDLSGNKIVLGEILYFLGGE